MLQNSVWGLICILGLVLVYTTSPEALISVSFPLSLQTESTGTLNNLVEWVLQQCGSPNTIGESEEDPAQLVPAAHMASAAPNGAPHNRAQTHSASPPRKKSRSPVRR
ncbi:unnamed protein product [Leuciscus chuanchicus]